eukprot:gb/GECH01007237.1/.p1 GENE.gb/GECH01007237.1/~~gb/GECH01007237.1/.p1  ORF type:complete len:750 (+),score=193.43 gb/GECH01007237.1/:1-2250(+)
MNNEFESNSSPNDNNHNTEKNDENLETSKESELLESISKEDEKYSDIQNENLSVSSETDETDNQEVMNTEDQNYNNDTINPNIDDNGSQRDSPIDKESVGNSDQQEINTSNDQDDKKEDQSQEQTGRLEDAISILKKAKAQGRRLTSEDLQKLQNSGLASTPQKSSPERLPKSPSSTNSLKSSPQQEKSGSDPEKNQDSTSELENIIKQRDEEIRKMKEEIKQLKDQQEDSNKFRAVIDELRKEASVLHQQFSDAYDVERKNMANDLHQAHVDRDTLQKISSEKDSVINSLRREIEQHRETSHRTEKQLREIQEHMEEVEEEKSKLTEELNKSKQNESKLSVLSKSSQWQADTAQKTLKSLKNQRHKLINTPESLEKLSKQLDTIAVKENEELKQTVKNLEAEKKESFSENHNYLQSLSEKVENAISQNPLMEEEEYEDLRQAELYLVDLENNNTKEFIYQPFDETDPLDYAVAKLLTSIKSPVRIELERLGPGEYLADRRLKLKLVRGQVVVHTAEGWYPFKDYIMSLYSPFIHPDRPIQIRGPDMATPGSASSRSASPSSTYSQALESAKRKNLSRSRSRSGSQSSLNNSFSSTASQYSVSSHRSNESSGSRSSSRGPPLYRTARALTKSSARNSLRTSMSSQNRSNSAPPKRPPQTNYQRNLKRNPNEKSSSLHRSRSNAPSPVESLRNISPRPSSPSSDSSHSKRAPLYKTNDFMEQVDVNDTGKLKRLKSLALKQQIAKMKKRR